MYINQHTSSSLLTPFNGNESRQFLQRGISLIELIMFIVILSVAVSGVLLVMNNVNRNSADAVMHKQALASAESLLEEVELQAFTKPAGGFAGPFTPANRANFDTVTDYNGFATVGIFSASTGTPIPGLGSYNANVTVTPTALAGIAAANSLFIEVTITDPQGNVMRLSSYRTNH